MSTWNDFDAGIIPARAGFTGRLRRRGEPLGDHPRSRGVYTMAHTQEGTMAGSSPLARGLPRPRFAEGRTDGIIPARAGFTRAGRSPPSRPADHPRSRGVYHCDRAGEGLLPGSSPLARGLLKSSDLLRIAGMDHPRSRGVYTIRHSERNTTMGSSPLARGLRRLGPFRQVAARIIPARAGFTRPRDRCLHPQRDHPRSRGVYGVTA